MKSRRERKSAQRIAKEAARWMHRLDQADQSELDSFSAWLQESPLHERTFCEIVKLDEALGEIDFLHLADSPGVSVTAPAAPEVRFRRSFRKPVLGGLVLASACVAAVAFVLTHLSSVNSTPERTGNPVCTGIGEVRSLSLEDGSTIELTTRTCVEVLVSATQRKAHLLQGEALFTVQHSDAMPFTVLTRHVAVDDLGTQFRIYEHENETDVEVLQGEAGIRVLSTPHNANRPPVRLGPGEGATVVRTPNAVTINTEKLSRETLERALAWRQGALEFNGDSLRRAVSEINRYNVRQLVIVDPAIENLSVGGRFRYSDFDTSAQSIAQALGIRLSADESNPNILKLSSLQSGFGEDHKRHEPVQQTAPR